MIISMGFSLNFEISGNMENQKNPVRTNLNLLRVPKCYVLLTLWDQNASECKFQKQTIFF